MKLKTIMLMFIFALASTLAHASTPFSSCGIVISTEDYYDQTNNITDTQTGNCIEVTGLMPGPLGKTTINCHSYSITDTATSIIYNRIYIHDNSEPVYVTGCNVNVPNGFFGNAGIYVINTTAAYLYGNHYNGSSVFISGCATTTGIISVFGEHVTGGAIEVFMCDHAVIAGNTVDNSGGVVGVAAAGISTAYANNTHIQNNTIIGFGTTHGVGLDDGIDIFGDSGNTTQYSGAVISGNTISSVYDCGIEIIDDWTNVTIQNNNISHYGVAAIGGFYHVGIDSFLIAGNVIHDSPTGAPFVFYSLYPIGASYFTNNTFSDNTYDGSNSTTEDNFLGEYGPDNQFDTYSNNSFTNNQFGNYAQFQSVSGVVDGGSNTCIGTTPSGALVCH